MRQWLTVAASAALVLTGCATRYERDADRAARADSPSAGPRRVSLAPSRPSAPVTAPTPSSSAPPAVSSPPLPVRSPGADFLRLPASRIVAAADRATRELRSVHVVGTAAPDGNTPAPVDLIVTGSGDCRGTVVDGFGAVEVVVVGADTFLRPSPAFWRATRPRDAEDVISYVGRRYVERATDVTRFSAYCQVGALTGLGVPASSVEKAGTTLVGDQPVVRLRVPGGGLGITEALVALTGPHRYLQVASDFDDSELRFDRFDGDAVPSAPARRDVVEVDGLFI